MVTSFSNFQSIGMSCALLAIPGEYLYDAYKAVTFKLNPEFYPILDNNGSEVAIGQDENLYKAALNIMCNDDIEETMKTTLKKAGIKRRVYFAPLPFGKGFHAFGTPIFNSSDLAILYSKKIHDIDPEASQWAIKHEIGHIKSSDVLTLPIIGAISSLAAAILFMNSNASFMRKMVFTALAGSITSTLFTRWRENAADNFAIENSTDEELLEGRRVLMAFQQTFLSQRVNWWTNLLISSNGDCRIDLWHPLRSQRITNIEVELARREVAFDSEVQNKLIAKLVP